MWGGEWEREGEGISEHAFSPRPLPPFLSPLPFPLSPHALSPSLSLSLSLSPSLSPSPSPHTPGLSCRRPAPRPLGCAESRGTPAVAPLPLSPLGDLRALGVLRGEGGGRKKEKGGERRSPCACVLVYRGSTPGPLRCVLPSPHLPSRGPCGLQQGRDSKREPEHATAHHHHPQHSATLHSLSSPPRPPSLARTKRAQTHTNPRKPPTQPRTSLPKGPDWPMGRKGRRSEKDPVSRAPNASLPDQGRVGGVGEHPGGAGRQLPGRGWSAPPGGRYPVPYIYPNSTLT